MTAAVTASDSMPLAVVEARGETLEQTDPQLVRDLIEERGAVLLRGFATTVEGFAALGHALCATSVFNESPNREMLGEGVQVQSVNLGADPFPLHPELAREPWRPDLAMFACLDPPSVGGQTNVCDGIAIADNLPPEVRRALEGKRLFYIRPASPELLRYWLGTDQPDDKDAIMAKLGRTEARIMLEVPMSELPARLGEFPLSLEDGGKCLLFRGGDGTGKGKREVADILRLLVQGGIAFEGVETSESTLEDIFVDLVEGREGAAA